MNVIVFSCVCGVASVLVMFAFLVAMIAIGARQYDRSDPIPPRRHPRRTTHLSNA